MPIVIAAAPILISVVMILALRQSALRAGAAGLVTALLVVFLAEAYWLNLGELRYALLSGALTTLLVSYVLFGGLLVYSVLREAGALTALAERAPNPLLGQLEKLTATGKRRLTPVALTEPEG